MDQAPYAQGIYIHQSDTGFSNTTRLNKARIRIVRLVELFITTKPKQSHNDNKNADELHVPKDRDQVDDNLLIECQLVHINYINILL